MEIENYQIAAFGVLPFIVLLIIYIVILCRRKIEDYYLKWCSWILMAAINLRIFMSSIVSTVYYF